MANPINSQLLTKLGLKPGMRAIIMRSPRGYLDSLGELPDGLELVSHLNGRFDFIHYFSTSPEQLGAVMPNLAAHLESGGMLWVSWAKRTSPLYSGLDEAMVRKLGLAAGLVDVKVAAVTNDQSGLKFVYRIKDR